MSLNRRGSRSEGRLNLTVADRLAETERIKKEAAVDTTAAITTTIATAVPLVLPVVVKQCAGLFDGMCGVTIVSSSDADPKEKLGVAGRHHMMPKRPCDLRSYVADQLQPNKTNYGGCKSSIAAPRSNSVDHTVAATAFEPPTTMTFLTESSTMPITGGTGAGGDVNCPLRGYKTMPSPTRSNTILPSSPTNGLNEIFEEGTDVGSSDSATTTPRPSTRHSHYINAPRAQSQQCESSAAAGIATGTGAPHRRSKFHKTRTVSCSSSDASDDDSENRKKRAAHKIVDSTKPLQAQRRDSHDDSSDSQDHPSNAAGSAGALGAGNDSQHQQQQTHSSSSSKQQKDGRSTGGNSRQKAAGQSMGFRRHRTGRRRAGETRLRESQSLNRITEVQESELPLTSLVQTAAAQISMATNNQTPVVAVQQTTTKSRGFSARLFGFRKADHHHHHQQQQEMTSPSSEQPRQAPIATAEEEVELVLGVELAKALKTNTTAATETKNSSSASKKLKMLGRYFQVGKITLYKFILLSLVCLSVVCCTLGCDLNWPFFSHAKVRFC